MGKNHKTREEKICERCGIDFLEKEKGCCEVWGKQFKQHKYVVKEGKVWADKKVIQAILHHSFPSYLSARINNDSQPTWEILRGELLNIGLLENCFICGIDPVKLVGYLDKIISDKNGSKDN